MEGEITIKDERFLNRPLQLPVRLRRTELMLFSCDIETAWRHLDP